MYAKNLVDPKILDRIRRKNGFQSHYAEYGDLFEESFENLYEDETEGDQFLDFDEDGETGEDPPDDDDEEEDSADEPVEEEEIAAPSPKEISRQIGSDAIGSAITGAIAAATSSAVSANLQREGMARELRLLYEDEGFEAKLPPLDIAAFATEIGDLISNYTVRIDVPNMIYMRARAYVQDNYGLDWALAFDEALSRLNLSVGIGGDERGPMAVKPFEPIGKSNSTNPMTGPISVGGAGDGGGGGGGM